MKKKIWLTAAVCAAGILLLLLLLRGCGEKEAPVAEILPEPVQEEIQPPYESPVDFKALQKENPEIYAWLDIPGTAISYPVAQSAEDDTYYLTHGADGKKNAAGALFTEHVYNSNDFTDLLTAVYGHRQNDSTMFGDLQMIFSDSESFRDHREFIVYLPEGELHYEIFAAVPCDNRHIPYTYTVACDYEMAGAEAFLKMVYETRTLDANFTEDDPAVADDHIVVLSTCQKVNRQNRYLVMGKLREEQSVLPADWLS